MHLSCHLLVDQKSKSFLKLVEMLVSFTQLTQSMCSRLAGRMPAVHGPQPAAVAGAGRAPGERAVAADPGQRHLHAPPAGAAQPVQRP